MIVTKPNDTKASPRLLALAMMSVSSLALLTPVAAQEGSDEADLARTDTIVVTAQKREQTLLETPVAVSVVDADTIQRAEILDIIDLQSVVPSLNVDQGRNAGRTQFSIRGFTGSGSTPGIEQSVAVFVDGVFRTRAQAAIADLPNIQRVEVLRGPQSTLFGKNASAGVISFVTEEAQFIPKGYVEAAVSNFNGYRGKAYFTGPLTEDLAFSLGGSFNKRDGTVEEEFTGTDINDRNRYAVNGELRYAPSERLDVRLQADFSDIDEVCCESEGGIFVAGSTAPAIEALGVDLNLDDPFPRNPTVDIIPSSDIQNAGGSLDIDYDFGFATLTSLTAYRISDNEFRSDTDSTAGDFIGANNRSENLDTFTQEVRLTSNGDGFVDWLVGVFYMDDQLDVDANFLYGAQNRSFFDILSGGNLAVLEGLAGFAPGTFIGEGQGIIEAYDQDNQALSVFANTDWNLTDKFTLTLGLNYSYDRKEVAVGSVSTDVFSSLDLNTIAGGAFVGLQAFQFLRPVQTLPNAIEPDETEDDRLTYTVRGSYQFNDNLNVYATYATGFKASSWNYTFDSTPVAADVIALEEAGLAVPNLTPSSRFAGPEDSYVFELGLKAQYDLFTVNLALFYQTIEDFQSIVVETTGSFFANAEERVTRGVEVDAWLYPMEGLTITFSGTYLDAFFEEFTNSVVGDISGTADESVPNFQTSLGFIYNFPVGQWDGFVRGDWQWQDDRRPENPSFEDVIDEVDGLSLINAAAGVELPRGFSARLWARNLLDEQEVTSVRAAIGQPGTFHANINQPRTFGFTIRKSF